VICITVAIKVVVVVVVIHLAKKAVSAIVSVNSVLMSLYHKLLKYMHVFLVLTNGTIQMKYYEKF